MKKQIKLLIYTIMVISLVACTFVGVRRVQVENQYKDVEIAVRYSDVLRLSLENDISMEEALTQFKNLGATTLLVKENTVASPSDSDYYSYKALGKLSLVDGYILKFYYSDVPNINGDTRYIMTDDKEVADNIEENYAVKGMVLNRFEKDNKYFLEIGEYSSYLTAIGVGFDKENLETAAQLGFSISPQLKNWDVENEEEYQASLEYVINEVASLPNVNTIYFSDSKVPGAATQTFAHFIEEKYQLGFIEFSSNKQEGFSTLAKDTSEKGTNYKVVRLHTLEDPKVNKFSVSELMDRYDLALKERNNRVFLFKMPNTGMVDKDFEYISEAITTFEKDAQADGYTISPVVPNYNLPQVPAFVTFLSGFAAVMVFILLLADLGFVKIGYVLGILGIIGYAGLLKLKVNLGCQLMALFGSIMFPTYAMTKGIRKEPRNLKETLITYIEICGISFGGVLTTIGVLSKTNFALGLDLFMGVKLATTIPIVLILAYLIYKEHHFDLKYYTGLLQKKISYGALLLLAVLGGVLLIYVSRSGNSGSTSNLELAFRQMLDNVLGVRPRTKEILIGYPILLAFLYYGYKERYIIFIIFAIMGPISLVNTYGHIHTPVLISLIRSGYGILIGAIIGLILIKLIKIVNKVIKKWQTQLR